MIFIVTPSIEDFKAVCSVKKLPVKRNFNGMITHKNIRWISGLKRLRETNVNPTQVFYGYRFNEFEEEEKKIIKIEIEMRMLKR